MTPSASDEKITREDFARAFLQAIGAPRTERNLWACVAWMQAEGSAARFNPLATTQKMDGSQPFNSVGVQHYVSFDQGVAATAKTLNDGANRAGDPFNYQPIRRRLRTDAWARNTLLAVEDSAWGTGGLALRCLRQVKRSWEFYRNMPIGQ